MTTFRLNPFKARDPEMWFAIAERSLEAAGILDERAKFNHVVEALDDNRQKEVREIILRPPETKEYTTLKNILLAQLAEDQEDRIRQAVEKEELGDRKPTQFLAHLRDLAGNDLSKMAIKAIWKSRLPKQVRLHLIRMGKTSLKEMADAVMAELNDEKSCNATEAEPNGMDKIVESRSFTIYTDQKPLVYAFQQKPEVVRIRGFWIHDDRRWTGILDS